MSGSILTWLLTNVLGQRPSVQQVSLIRKLIYLALILVLFTASYFFRVTVAEPQALALAVRDRDVGEVELAGSAARLAMSGTRGFMTCAVWVNAIEKQKKGQWEELDQLVTYATWLQPHFNTPWQFQSWNMAFNVVNRCDQPGDKYFYIARGLDLLAQGERQNRFDPELRFHVGLYYQMRIGRWEYWPLMTSLLELSCIDPLLRDPARFQHQVPPQFQSAAPDRRVLTYSQIPSYVQALKQRLAKLPTNPGERTAEQAQEADALAREIAAVETPVQNFDKFCQDYPRLIRRLREPPVPRLQQPYSRPEQIVGFLEKHRDIPSLYEAGNVETRGEEKRTARKRNKDHPFPIWPQDPEAYDPEQPPNPSSEYIDVNLDGENDPCDLYLTARAWFVFAQVPLPDPIKERPGASNDDQVKADPLRKRIPKRMTTIIFRNYPSRARSYVAERLAEEGWFDETGWELEWDASVKAAPRQLGERLKGEGWGEKSWTQAYSDWSLFGIQNGIQLRDDELRNLRTDSVLYRQRVGLEPGMYPVQPADPDPKLQEWFRAAEQLHLYEYSRRLLNYPHHFHRAETERLPATIAARKALFDVQKEKERGRLTPDQYPAEVERVMDQWRDVLLANPIFAADSDQQTNTNELTKKYNEAYSASSEGEALKKLNLMQAALGQSLTPDVGLQAVQAFRVSRWTMVAPPEQTVYSPAGAKVVRDQCVSVMGLAGVHSAAQPWAVAARAWVGPPAVMSPDGPLDDLGRPVYHLVPPR